MKARCCRGCGVEFTPRAPSHWYHEPGCGRGNRRPRPCQGCGVVFTPAHGRQGYHDPACRKRSAKPRGPLEAARARGLEVVVPERPARGKREPWHREQGEPAGRYEAFSVYLALGRERTGGKLQAVLGHGYSRVKHWAAEGQWKERAAAWDLDQERRFRDANADEKLAMTARQAKLGRQMQELAAVALERCRAKAVPAYAAATLAKIGFEIERAARGEPSAIEEHRVPEELLHLHRATLSRMSDEDLEQAIGRIERELAAIRSSAGDPEKRAERETPN